MSNNNGDLMEKRITKRDEKCSLLTRKIEKKLTDKSIKIDR